MLNAFLCLFFGRRDIIDINAQWSVTVISMRFLGRGVREGRVGRTGLLDQHPYKQTTRDVKLCWGWEAGKKRTAQNRHCYASGLHTCSRRSGLDSSMTLSLQMSQLKRWCFTSISLTPSLKGRKVSGCLGSSQSRDKLKENWPISLKRHEHDTRVRPDC